MRVWFSISCLIWSSEDSTPEDEGATEAAVGVGVDEGGFARTGEAVLMGAGAAAGVGLDSERMGMDERGCGREISSKLFDLVFLDEYGCNTPAFQRHGE